MQQAFALKVLFAVAAAVGLAACATTPAPDFGGRWKPVNRFDAATTEIPLYSSYSFQASPMDGTLKSMLERWAKDVGMTLDYRIASDYTLYGAVSRIGTTNAEQAVADVTEAYAAQGISVSIAGNQIVVQAASAAPASVPTATAAPTASAERPPAQSGS